MLKKFNKKFSEIRKALFSEKIPTIMCLIACTASIFMGFAAGYVIFASEEDYFVYADTGSPYQADSNITTDTPTIYDLLDEPLVFDRQVPHDATPTYLYVVTVLDGYIVVYHAPGFGGGIKELTSTPIGALEQEELERLIAGVRVYSDEALVRVLQDYGS